MKTWEKKDIIAIILIPLLLLARWLVEPLPAVVSIGIMFVLALLAMAILIRLYRDVLAKDWASFRRKLWLKILICILGVIAIVGLLALVRMVLPLGEAAANNGQGGSEEVEMFIAFSILFSLTPLFIAFQEEVILRHVLFYKHKSNKWLAIVLFFLSAFIFGAIHFAGFGGELIQTVPYMFVGAFFNLLYLFSKNIWFVLITHLLFNFIMAVLPAIAIPIMLLFN